MVDEDYLEAMDNSAEPLEPYLSETEVFNIETTLLIEGYPQMVKGIKAAFFCEYLQEVDIKGSETIPVIVEVKHLYVDDQIVTDKEKMKLRLDVIGRVGKNYARLQDIE